MLDSRQLLHFLTIAQRNSFISAAKKLNLSQPALSRSIQGLEETLGAKLFHRSTKKVSLTPYGEALLPLASHIINSLHDADQIIDALKGLETGEFKVGFGPVYADLLAAPAIARFTDQYPKVNIYTKLGWFTELIEDLNTGKIDIFIGETSTLIPRVNYVVEELKKRFGAYFCRADHPIINRKHVNHDLIAAYPLISYQLPLRMLSVVKKQNYTFHTDKQTFFYSNIVCDSSTIAKQIVKSSNAICFIPEVLATHELERGELRKIKIDHEKLSSRGGIVRLAGRIYPPAVEKFSEIVRALDAQFL